MMLERLKLWVDLKKGQFQNKYCKTYLTIKIFLHVNDCIVFLKKSIHSYYNIIIALYTVTVVYVSGLLPRFQVQVVLVYTKTVDSVFCVL